ncbi:MAG: C40 family peptidase [Polymorphobacter sp.]
MITKGSDAPDRVARLSGPRPALDPRRHIARPDLVDIALAGCVAAARYVEPQRLRCHTARTPMRKSGDAAAVAVSELLCGEDFDVFETVDGWAFGRSVGDNYTGWVAAAALDEAADLALQRITARCAPVFATADIKAPVLAELPFGARVAGVAGDRFLALASGGFVHLRHLAAVPADDLAVARLFSGAPYLWGGRTPAGVDCSGLVQAALAACAIGCPRDSDQQRDEVGQAVAFDDRAAGDLVFFPGHVGMLATRDRLFHANAHWMATVEEPLADVIARLAATGVAEPVTGVRRVRM